MVLEFMEWQKSWTWVWFSSDSVSNTLEIIWKGSSGMKLKNSFKSFRYLSERFLNNLRNFSEQMISILKINLDKFFILRES